MGQVVCGAYICGSKNVLNVAQRLLLYTQSYSSDVLYIVATMYLQCTSS